MAFCCRFRQSKLLKLHISRCFYTVIHHPLLPHNQCLPSRSLLNHPNCIPHTNLSHFYYNLRFYAAPLQASQKKEEKDASGPRLNEKITAPSVRLVTDEGHLVISRYEALSRAKSLDMDLVEVDRNAKPPVCKIFDYHKEKYIQQTKEKERAKSKNTLKKGGFKEVRFAAKIKQKDLQMKADMVRRLMESGHRVKCTAIEPIENMDLETLLSRFSALIEDVAVEESGPQIEKKQAYIVVRHAKFGPPKRSGKKASSNNGRQSKNQPMEDGSETADELSDEEVKGTRSGWVVSDRGDDALSVFDINDEESMLPRSLKDRPVALSGASPYAADRNPKRLVEPAATSTHPSTSLEVNRYARDPLPPPPLPPSGAPNQAMENRYSRNPRPGRASGNATGSSGNGAGNGFDSVPEFPNHGRQEQFTLPQTRPSQQEASGTSPPHSSTKSYGIFSSKNNNLTDDEQNANAAAATNRYQKNVGCASEVNPERRGPGIVNNPRHGRWGNV